MLSNRCAAAGLALASLALGGCASVVSGTTQPVSVIAVCEGAIVRQAMCTLTNDRGRWDIVSPGPVTLQKSAADLKVECRKGDAAGSASFVSKPNSGAWGNIVAGGLIGYAIDSGSGAAFNYPDEMPVVMQPPCPAP